MSIRRETIGGRTVFRVLNRGRIQASFYSIAAAVEYAQRSGRFHYEIGRE